MHRWGAAGRLAGYSGEIRTRMPTSHPTCIVAFLIETYTSLFLRYVCDCTRLQYPIVTKRVLVLSVCHTATTPIYSCCRSTELTPLGTEAALPKLPTPWKFQKSLPWVFLLSVLKVASEIPCLRADMDTLKRSIIFIIRSRFHRSLFDLILPYLSLVDHI